MDFSGVQLKHCGGLAYLDRAGPEIPILFLHGNGFSKEVFANQFLSKRLADHRLIALDLPGHGDSTNSGDPDKTYSYGGFAVEVEAFVRQIGVPQCIVAGWSLGGQIAMEMLCEPSNVAGVFAFGAPPAPAGPFGLVKAMHFSKVLLLAGKSEFKSADAAYFEKACLTDFSDGRFFKSLMRTDPAMRPALSKSVLTPRNQGQWEAVLASVKPVCLLHGDRDPLVRSSYMKALNAETLYGGKVFILEEAAHAPFLESQEVFDCLLSEFARHVFETSGQTAASNRSLKMAAGSQ